ncbi:MAG: tRNA (N(6)-L-threonylcarbamoyladenosine(37)-C(2))-methylthiotransferase MtaB [Rhodobacteraceae bacterium]|nr:tRNA (N(6)-L-threonylcarbamoyladenosine(37)-C(2))-methylthiotransferase MtaB [Paracoccaceae bacterium]
MGDSRIHTETLGCRLNAFESEAMRELALGEDMENIVIVNTCAVTTEAARKSRQAVRRCRRRYPDRRIIVTGCAAQIEPDEFAGIEGVDIVLGNSSKLQPGAWRKLSRLTPEFDSGPSIVVEDVMEAESLSRHLIAGFGNRACAFVRVQDGCDHRCTFCIIPYGRGNSRSAPAGQVVDQVKMLVRNGYKEIVLTGVDLTSWGSDLPGKPGFGNLVHRIATLVPELPRLRLSSIDPAEIDEEFIAAFASHERVMPHLHLSLQAGDDMILKRMKRRHLREDVIETCRRLRSVRPDVVFGADLIAGFPTESETMFENSLSIVEECELTWLHVFPFSPRPGTPAARMPQVPPPLVRERAARLRRSGSRRVESYLDRQLGTIHSVLAESSSTARNGQYAEVQLDEPQIPGEILQVRIAGHDRRRLAGTTLKRELRQDRIPAEPALLA